MTAATPRTSSRGILEGLGAGAEKVKEFTPTGMGPTRQSSSSWSNCSESGDETKISFHSRSTTVSDSKSLVA